MAVDWNHIRALRYSAERPPVDWPANVQPISGTGLALLGIEPETNKLYWDGKEVVLRDRIRLAWPERAIGFFAAVGTFGYFLMELGISSGGE